MQWFVPRHCYKSGSNLAVRLELVDGSRFLPAASRHIVLRRISKLRMQLEVTMFGERSGAGSAQACERAASDGPQSLSDTTRASLSCAPASYISKLNPRGRAIKHKVTNARANWSSRVTVAVSSLYSSRSIHRDNGMLRGDNGKQLRYYKRP